MGKRIQFSIRLLLSMLFNKQNIKFFKRVMSKVLKEVRGHFLQNQMKFNKVDRFVHFDDLKLLFVLFEVKLSKMGI